MGEMTGRFRSRRAAVAFYIGMGVFVFMVLFPLAWVFKLSIVPQSDLFQTPPTAFPSSITADNYARIFRDEQFTRSIGNSIVIAGLTTLICLAFGSMCSYALARIRFSLRRPIQVVVLSMAFFPGVALIAPLFLAYTQISDATGVPILDTYQSMIVPDVLLSLPIAVFLLTAYFRELPNQLEEAARLDGCNTWQAFWKVTVPLSIPGVVTTGILVFILSWSDFLFANTFTSSITSQPATVVIPRFATVYTTDYGAQAAAAIVVTLPLAVMVLHFQKRIVSGLTAGAGK
jgi:multiple sugar transport system permease protein